MAVKIIESRGQIAVFVIIALVIVAGIAITFLVTNQPEIDTELAINNPQQFISNCIEDPLEEIEEQLITNNGFLEEPENNFIIYKGRKVPYLCTVSEFYSACTPQEPMFLGNIRKNIQEQIQPSVESCFESLITTLKRQGYDVSEKGKEKVTVRIKQDDIEVNMEKQISIEKSEDTRNFEKFTSEINSPLNRLATVAQQIVNYESTYCEFNLMNWNMKNTEEIVKRFRASDQTKIYTITDRNTEKNIEMAVRTCVLPAGI